MNRFNLILCFLMLALPGASQALTSIYAGTTEQSELYKQQLRKVFSGVDCNCVITVGKKALEETLLIDNRQPIFATHISAASFLEKKSQHPNRQITAIYHEPDPSSLIALGQAIFGKYSLALMYSERSVYLKGLHEDVKYIETSKSEIRNELGKLTGVSAVVVIPDSNIWNTHSFRLAVYSLYRQRKALIGFNESLVQAGAIAGLTIEDNTYNLQIENKIRNFIQSGQLPRPSYPEKYKIEFNSQIARTLNIVLPNKETLSQKVNNRGIQ